MTAQYQIAEAGTRAGTKQLADFLVREGQLLLPMVQLVETAEVAIDDLIDVMGRATIEAVLRMSAEQVAGPKQQGKAGPDRQIHWYGSQAGRVALRERQLRVSRPRLRRKESGRGRGGEVPIPAYEAMGKDGALAERMLSILMEGVSTRQYEKVLPAMAEQAGVSKSQVSRENIEAGARLLKSLAERDFSDKDLVVIYIDGLQFSRFHVLAAVGVDAEGDKHVLGLREGATENAEVAKALLEDLGQRGVKPGRRRLFVIDGAKALRTAIDQVYGADNPVQRCRNHKRRNVLSHLPKEQHHQATATLRAAWKLRTDEGCKKLEQYASWVEREWPSAAASIREGMRETFTVTGLELPPALARCLVTTNLIDSTHSGVRQRTNRVTNWQCGEMVLRWAASAFVQTESSYRKIMGHSQLWMLKAHLDEPRDQEAVANRRKTG